MTKMNKTILRDNKVREEWKLSYTAGWGCQWM